jgi:hypothetical protein
VPPGHPLTTRRRSATRHTPSIRLPRYRGPALPDRLGVLTHRSTPIMGRAAATATATQHVSGSAPPPPCGKATETPRPPGRTRCWCRAASSCSRWTTSPQPGPAAPARSSWSQPGAALGTPLPWLHHGGVRFAWSAGSENANLFGESGAALQTHRTDIANLSTSSWGWGDSPGRPAGAPAADEAEAAEQDVRAPPCLPHRSALLSWRHRVGCLTCLCAPGGDASPFGQEFVRPSAPPPAPAGAPRLDALPPRMTASFTFLNQFDKVKGY